MKKFLILIAICLLVSGSIFAQEGVGDFPNLNDVGEPDEIGFAFIDGDTYFFEGVGEGLGDESLVDQFSFLNTEMSGSFVIEAFPSLPGESGRGGVMIRQNLEPGSIHTSLMMGDNLQTFPTFRTLPDGGSVIDGDPEPAEQLKMRLVKLGGSVHMYLVNDAGEATYLQTEAAQFQDPVLTGLAIYSGGSGDFSFFEFTEVSIDPLPLSVSRDIPTDTFEQGATVSGITLTASARSGEVVSTTVTEVVPEGASITLGSNSDGEVTMNDDGTFSWVLTDLSGEATLTYDVTLADSGISAVWKGTFTDEQYPGVQNFLAGDALLPSSPTFTGDGPFAIDPFFPTLVQVEQATLPEGAEQDLNLMYDPRTSNGISVVAVDDTITESWLEFSLTIPEDGVYYIFGNAREEDGNSDSWHTNMNETITGNEDATRWNINDGDDKQFNVQWVSREEPDENPRSFDLTAGPHTLYIHGREDSAQLDWIGVTTNPDLDLEGFDPNISVIASRTIEDNFIQQDETGTGVEISVVYRDIEGTFVIEEVVPSGFVVSDINASAGNVTENVNGGFSWDITGLPTQDLTLTYTVTPPTPEGNTFLTANIDGMMMIEGEEPTELAGDGAIVVEADAIDPTGKVAFYFQNVPDAAFQDNLMESHLRNQFGLEVQEYDDDDEPGFERPADLSGADMAIVSGSVGSGAIAEMNYHLNAEQSLITHESYLFDDYSFSETFDTSDSLGIDIIDNEHPITEGLELGLLQVHDEENGVTWAGSPPEGVRVLGTVPGEPTQAALWVIEPGTEVAGNTIPGIRLGLWTGTFTDLNNQGLDLMNRIIAYALGEDPPEPPTDVADFMLY